jgi:hypothetical protein
MLQIAWVEVGPCGVNLTLHGQPALLRQYDPKEFSQHSLVSTNVEKKQ